MGKKRLIMFGVASLAAVSMFAIVTQVAKSNGELSKVYAATANAIAFDIRNDENKFTYTSSYGEDGLVINVTSGNYEGWRFGLINWKLPVVAETEYYCQFTMTLNVGGSEGGGVDYSEVVLMCNENGGEGYQGANYYKAFKKDTEFTIGQTFKEKETTTAINLQMGALRNDSKENKFTAKIKEFVLRKENSTGPIVNRINFESGESWLSHWKEARSKGLCSSDAKATVLGLIEDYDNLIPAQRDEIADTFDASYGETKYTIAQSVEYFRTYWAQ